MKLNVLSKVTLAVLSQTLLVSCLSESSNLDCSVLGGEVNCSAVANFSVVMNDQFSRKTVVAEDTEDFLTWRKIIDDVGRIVADQSGNNVNSEVVDDTDLGPAADGSKYLIFYGRQGGSVHNLYLVSETLQLSQVMTEANVVTVKFKYLPVDLEEGEYLSLEVCNNTVEECGVGSEINLDGLNGPHWKTVFSTGAADEGLDFNGRDHLSSDYITAHVPVYVDEFQREQFVVRFNVRVDEGFRDNERANEMVDGVLLDSVQITAIEAPEVVDEETVDEVINDEDFDGVIEETDLPVNFEDF